MVSQSKFFLSNYLASTSNGKITTVRYGVPMVLSTVCLPLLYPNWLIVYQHIIVLFLPILGVRFLKCGAISCNSLSFPSIFHFHNLNYLTKPSAFLAMVRWQLRLLVDSISMMTRWRIILLQESLVCPPETLLFALKSLLAQKYRRKFLISLFLFFSAFFCHHDGSAIIISLAQPNFSKKKILSASYTQCPHFQQKKKLKV
mmetsp:Transcript_17800/g.26500  ORF Transcript_17800/g.26500 Transcript_17800/m.26500 type:complete len:201 (+) Transcript_17800:144-746(+)